MLLTFTRWPGLDIFAFANAFISRVATFSTLLIEFLFPLFVWFRKFRLWLTLGLIFLHLALFVLFEGLAMFNGAMIVAAISFLPSRRTKEFIYHFIESIKSKPISDRLQDYKVRIKVSLSRVGRDY